MNPKHFRVRIDRNSGELWLTLEKPGHPMRKISNITDQVMVCLMVDLCPEEGTLATERDVKFQDGSMVRITVTDMGMVDPPKALQAA